jgi:hypothetical protein
MNRHRSHHNIFIKPFYYIAILLVVAFTGIPAVHAEDVVAPDSTSSTQPTSSSTTEIATPSPESAQTAPSTTSDGTTATTNSSPSTTPATGPTDVQTTPPTGPQQPTGADANSYTYNDSTGLWENDKYTWDPATHQTSPKTTPTYSFNPETGMWDTTEWVFNAPTGTYVPNVISAALPPENALAVDAAGQPVSMDTAKSLSQSTDAKKLAPSNSLSDRSASDADKNGAPTGESKSSGFFDLFYNVLISNKLSSTAHSGDALVTMNTLAGSALSGDASAVASIINLLQSTWNLGLTGGLFSTFTQNLFGDVVGDLWLQPGNQQPSGSVTALGDLTVNASQNTGIDNQITLEATSGNATVSSNTTAGDATTGSATVIANIINAINSSIASGSSFLGMLNIYGNLNGDILLPPDVISTLLAANTLGSLDTSAISNTEVLGDFTTTESIKNDVNATAGSGGATVAKNTSAGNASTGDATTNITVLNLTGRQVIGKNALLVFVNVLGTWVGMIVDAPAGTTSAALGGGITDNRSLAVTADTTQTINNDITASAQSGDALVTKNTSAGNATSGDAYAAVNILNLNTSQFSLSDWFGVLFINVFGSWTGSFGIDTAAGTLPPAAVAAVQANSSPHMTHPSVLAADSIRAFSFTPHDDGSYSLEPSDQGVAALAEAHVLSDQASAPETAAHSGAMIAHDLKKAPQVERDWTLALITTTLGASLLGAERIATRRTLRR